MFRDFGHGVGKAYRDMSTGEKTVYGLALFALAGVVADNVANEGKYTKVTKDKLDKVYQSLVKKTPAAAVAIDSPTQPLAPVPTVGVNGSAVKETPHYDWYDAELNIRVEIENYEDTPSFVHNVTRMFQVMQEKTPKLYEEAMNAFKQTPKKIVKSELWGERNNFNSEDMIGLAGITEQLGGSEDIKLVLAADSDLYAEMMASTILEKPLKNRYESELYQHSNVAKYGVAAGITTKENMNEWLKEGRWFEFVVGRLPTPEDKEGVDINKYLIQ